MGSNRVCHRISQVAVHERTLHTEVCIRSDPRDWLFGAGAEDLCNDTHLAKIEASVRQQADYIRRYVV